MLDFPNSPTLGQQYTLGDKTWQWNGVAWDAVNPYATKAELAAGSGASLVTFTQAGAGAVPRSQQDRGREEVSVTDYGADPSGANDSTDAIEAAFAYVTEQPTTRNLVFAGGIYKAAAFPNFAVQNLVVEAQGEVRLRYTGSGNALTFDAGSGSELVFNVTFKGNFIVEAPSTAGHGVYVRSVHHSLIEARVAGCGTTSAAFQVEFAVCTTFIPRATGNEGWYTGPNGVQAAPQTGLFLTKRGSSPSSACLIVNPIIEGVGVDGIVFDYAMQNQVHAGTSEGHIAGFGVRCTANAGNNSFYGTDFESNPAGGIKEGGSGNAYLGIVNANATVIDATALQCTLRGGYYDAIADNGTGTIMDGIRYATNGGALTGTGTKRAKRSVYNATAATFNRDQYPGTIEAASTSVPNATATTVLTLPSSGNTMFHVYAYLPSVGAAAAYGAYAVVYQDGASSRIMSQTNGANLTITLSGQNVQVTQTSGITQNVYATARPA